MREVTRGSFAEFIGNRRSSITRHTYYLLGIVALSTPQTNAADDGDDDADCQQDDDGQEQAEVPIPDGL